MRTSFLRMAVVFCLAAAASVLGVPRSASAQITLEILNPTPRVQDVNFGIGGTFGFSVSHDVPDRYRVYATTGHQSAKWAADSDTLENILWMPNWGMDTCDYRWDPRNWDDRCLEGIGHYWKNIACGAAPCEWDGRWNAAPGSNNVSVYPVRYLWPRTDDWGTLGFSPIITKDVVNGVHSSPPTTGVESECQPHNPGAYASGAANAKAVQVKYADGSTRWFMAFNHMIHAEKETGYPWDPNQLHNSADKWRISWATSPDGANWTIHPQLLLRSTGEQTGTPLCSGGVLVTGLMVDNNYFYMTFTEVNTRNVYLARAAVNATTKVPGYGTWQIADGVSFGNFTWKSFTLGSRINLAAFGARPTFNPPSYAWGGPVRQTQIARVFASSAPYSASRYVALSGDLDASGNEVVNVFSSTSMSKEFTYESTAYLPADTRGPWGREFAFTHWPDNVPATPRIVSSQFDLWFAQQGTNPEYPQADPSPMVSRRTAKLRGGIFPN